PAATGALGSLRARPGAPAHAAGQQVLLRLVQRAGARNADARSGPHPVEGWRPGAHRWGHGQRLCGDGPLVRRPPAQGAERIFVCLRVLDGHRPGGPAGLVPQALVTDRRSSMHGSLSVLIWLPIAAGIVVLLLGERNIAAGRWLALLASIATLLVCLPLLSQFDTTTAAYQFTEKLPWITRSHAYYALGLDGISLPLIVLTAFVTIPVIIAAWSVIEARPAQYFAAFLIMEGLMIGVFSATDALLFYFFWEAMLIPMFLIIGIWGGPRRVYATIKFFLYTFLGSVFMLVALIYMYVKAGDYAIASFQKLPLTLMEQRWIFIAFLLAFAVKVPMWPVHTWLPDAHVEAPTGGSVILAAIMLKMGGYGFLRFSLPVAPDASRELDLLLITLSLIAVIYIGYVALVQPDMKKLIAYSSISHMGF